MESSISSSFVCSSGGFFLSPASWRIFKIGGFLGGLALLRSPMIFCPSGFLSSSSTFRKEVLSHSWTASSSLSPSINTSLSWSIYGYFPPQNIATSLPPCPSNTPKSAFLSLSMNLSLATCASSYFNCQLDALPTMLSLQPCIDPTE